ncbi:protein phosphatase 2C domain-containing protein [Nocardioides rubriscoriae]|uniref:protein phosphatase 2C domain-containing protein n=1 Tax=Nocardioides rubriscoriae TaxID=642762 RepID=UPI001FE6DCE3|nr:protein phosphatase 2C domain-containing protein [Nocardioides rubriscoriae]
MTGRTPRAPRPAGWGVASATTIGSFHVATHLPHQDSVRTWAAPDGSAAVVVVADGHGHHAHFRSDVGADLATALTLDALTAALEGAGEVDPAAVAVDAVSAWRRAVLEHVAAHPLRSDEARRGPLVPYGTTLVALAVSDDRLVALQVGDGDTVVVRASGRAWRPLPDDPDGDGVRTASLCQPDPMSSLRTATVDLAADAADQDDPVVLAMVCTDGFGKARADPDTWWSTTARDLAATVRDGGLDALRARLPADVGDPAQVGGDDTSIAVVAATS